MEAGLFFTFLFLFVGSIVTVNLNNRYKVRELEHKEKLAALEKGVDLPTPRVAPWTPRTYLLHGMIWLFAGLASMVAILAIAITLQTQPVSAEQKVRNVTEARARGATPEELQLLLHESGNNPGIPIGLGLLGLIPVGVGIAYLIFYRMESKKLLS
jgi:hypothetical protein